MSLALLDRLRNEPTERLPSIAILRCLTEGAMIAGAVLAEDPETRKELRLGI
jgi:hypothetical protein